MQFPKVSSSRNILLRFIVILLGKLNTLKKVKINFIKIIDCGMVSGHIEPLIVNGKEEEAGESPWHTAVYKTKDKVLICGGTIISSHVILSGK